MTSRQTLPQQAVRARTSLMGALRAPGDNTDLIAQRARHLLACRPSGVDANTWLTQVLPEAWHVEKAVAALAVKSGGMTNGAADRTGTEEVTVTSPRRQDRRSRRRR